MRLLGLDEAGRGCVLGPLVVGAFLYETGGSIGAPGTAGDADQAPLRAAGAEDSKMLSPAKRAAARERLRALGGGHVQRIEATEIDEGNINELEIRAFISLTRALRPDAVWLDAPVHPKLIPKLQQRLVRETGVAAWVIEPKADHTFPVVGAASIFAKLCRDEAIEALNAHAPLPVGSGYPSDPITRALLKALIGTGEALPGYVRTRWGTIQELRQQSLF